MPTMTPARSARNSCRAKQFFCSANRAGGSTVRTVFRRLAIVSALAVIALVIFFVSWRSASAVNYRVFDRLPSVARGAIHDGGVRLRGHVAGAPRATIHAQGRALDAGDGTFELEAFSEPRRGWASGTPATRRGRAGRSS